MVLNYLFQIISSNQQQFIGLLNEPVSGDQPAGEGTPTPAAPPSGGGGTGGSALGTGGTGGGPQMDGGYIQVTTAEKEAIERVGVTYGALLHGDNFIIAQYVPANACLILLFVRNFSTQRRDMNLSAKYLCV